MDNKNKIYSMEVEQTVLGCFMLDRKIQNKISLIEIDDFYYEEHQLLFLVIKKLYEKLIPIDLISVMNMVREREFNIEIDYIIKLPNVVVTTDTFDYYAKVLKDLKTNRVVAEKAKALTFLAEKNLDRKSLLSELRTIEQELSMASIDDFVIDIGETEIADIHESEKVASGFHQLDKALKGGYLLPSLNVITGRRGVGKSTFLNQVICEAISQGKKVFLFSGELSPGNLLYWITQCAVNQEQLVKVVNKDNTYYRANDAAAKDIKEWLKGNLFIYNTRRGNDINLLISYMNVLKARGVDVFILDNLMKLTDSSVRENENLIQTNIVSYLKDFADKTNSIVHLVAHAKKTFNTKIAPTEDEISGSGNITNLADYVTCIHRLYDEDRTHDAEIYLYKNRPAGKELRAPNQVKLLFSEERKRYYTTEIELIRDFNYNNKNQFIEVELDMEPFIS